MKKILLVLGVVLLLSGCRDFEDKKEITFGGKTLIHRGEDFKLGIGQNLILDDGFNIGLKDNEKEGFYESPIIHTSGYKELILSWNAHTPKTSNIEVWVQVSQNDTWSKWFTYGKWSAYENGGSEGGQSDKIAHMAIDTVKILGGKEADAFKYRIALRREEEQTQGPKISSIITTLKRSEESVPALAQNKGWQKELQVPERSQMVVPEIGNRICSPTSLAMVMAYYGHSLETEEVAAGVFDQGAKIYGNWVYNVAFAGSKDLHAYIDRFVSIDEIKEKIAEGTPVIASIMTSSEEALEGAPMAYPSGHLLVVRGFMIKDGVEYVIVNDPAAPTHESVRREYRLEQFEKAWRKIVYIVTPVEG